MPSRSRLRTFAVASALVLGIGIAPVTAHAGVDEAERKVEQVLDELDNLRGQLEQVDIDYGNALTRHDELTGEIAASQARIDELSLELGGVESALTKIAVDRFTSGDTLSLSPIFSNADTYSLAEQKAALGTVAIDTGQGDMDQLQFLVDELAKERKSLEKKQAEASSLIATLEQKRIDFEALEADYIAKEAQARAELGEAKLQAAEEARAAAAAEAQAAADAAAAAANANNGGGNGGGGTTAPPRGGGGNTGGGNTGGGNNGGGNNGGGVTTPPATPPPTAPPTAPPVSGQAGVAISAAYSQLGVPYKYAASSPGVAFDCSGLTKYAWGRAGVSLPHQSRAQYASVPHVAKSQVQPGDLIFYYSPIGHVGIYVGNGQMIHAPQSGDVVKVSNVNWGKVVGVGRPG